MTDHVIIPIASESLFEEDSHRTVYGGGTRMVPMVPAGTDGTLLPCIWKSHTVTQGRDNDEQPIPVHECLLLVSRDPILTIRAEVHVDAWKQFARGPVEW
jgi:hypothetical protein